jgi:hypothetical protein
MGGDRSHPWSTVAAVCDAYEQCLAVGPKRGAGHLPEHIHLPLYPVYVHEVGSLSRVP